MSWFVMIMCLFYSDSGPDFHWRVDSSCSSSRGGGRQRIGTWIWDDEKAALDTVHWVGTQGVIAVRWKVVLARSAERVLFDLSGADLGYMQKIGVPKFILSPHLHHGN